MRIFYYSTEAATTAQASLKFDRANLRTGLREDGETYLLTKTDGAIHKIVRHFH